MKKVFMVHGWDFDPEMNWYPWVKKELIKRGFKVEVLKMPNTSEPRIDEWVNHLKKQAGKVSQDIYFIGHSIGCQTIMRFLQGENSQIGGAIFVAGWFKLANLEGDEVEAIARPWIETKIDFTRLRANITPLTVILSDNDPYNCLQDNSKIFKNKLGAKVIIEKNKGHFTSEDGVTQMPEILTFF